MQTVLVVDDEEGVRMVVSRMLKRLGCKQDIPQKFVGCVRKFPVSFALE